MFCYGLKILVHHQYGLDSNTRTDLLEAKDGSKRLRLPDFETIGTVDDSHIMSMKNPNGPIGNRTQDLPVCSAVFQPTGTPRGHE